MQVDIVPINVGLQSVVDECGLFVEFVDKLSAERVGTLTAVVLLGDHAVTIFQKICGDIGGLSRHTIEGIVYIGFEFTVLQFPKIICGKEK